MRQPPLAQLMQEDRAHRSLYTDPDIFQLELERIFRGGWIFIGHESEVPNPGDFKTDTVAGQPIIITRAEDGAVHVLYNRCRHRGTIIRREETGKATTLICPFHGWTYGCDGRLLAVPSGEAFGFGGSLDQAQFGLVPVAHSGTNQGFVFASFSPDVPPLLEHLGEATRYLDLLASRAPDGRFRAGKPIRSVYAGNWKHFFDQEAFHAPILHASTFAVGSQKQPGKYGEQYSWSLVYDERYNDRSIGRGHGINDFGSLRQRDFRDVYEHEGYIDVLARRLGLDRARELAALDVHLYIYPNLFIHSRFNHYRVIKPLAVDRTEISVYPCELVGAPDDLNELMRRYTAQAVSAGGEVNSQDMDVFGRIQDGLQAEAVEWVYFTLSSGKEHLNEAGELVAPGTTEMLIREQHKEWLRLMTRPAAGG